MFGILLFCSPTRLPIPRIDSSRTCVAPPCPQTAALSPFKTRNAQRPLIGILPNRQLDLEEVQFHGTERSHIGPIGPPQDQHVFIASQDGSQRATRHTRPCSRVALAQA